jgi:hypothetical protein
MKKKAITRKIIGLFAAVCMLVSMLPAFAVQAYEGFEPSPTRVIMQDGTVIDLLAPQTLAEGIMPASINFEGIFPSPTTPITVGEGTASDPFVIFTAGQLAYLSERVFVGDSRYISAHYVLANDIDLSEYGANWNDGRGWIPIGMFGGGMAQPRAFRGTFDGNNHTITGLFMDYSSSGSLGDTSIAAFGLFGAVHDVVIQNLRIEGATIILSGGWVGGLAGLLCGEVNNVHFEGAIRGDMSMSSLGGAIGGIVGILGNGGSGVIHDSHSRGMIASNVHAAGGGIAGAIADANSSITDSSSTASVTGGFVAGGIIGTGNWNLIGRVENNLALNPFVQGRSSAGRIKGGYTYRSEEGTLALSNNRAYINMHTNGGIPFHYPPEIHNVHDGLNGQDISGVIIQVGTAIGAPGEAVDVPVSLLNNPGMAGFNLTLGFDSYYLTPLYITANDDLGGSVFVYNLNENNDDTLSVVWASVYDVHTEELFTIRFQINAHVAVPEGEDVLTPVPISVIDLLTEIRTEVDPIERNGYVVITHGDLLWGDVNVDGVVDHRDVLALAQFLAGLPDSEPRDLGLKLADVDRNDRVNIGDLILIAQYVADWDGSRGVVLGIPQ